MLQCNKEKGGKNMAKVIKKLLGDVDSVDRTYNAFRLPVLGSIKNYPLKTEE